MSSVRPRLLSMTALLALSACLLGSCGDDDENPMEPEETGTPVLGYTVLNQLPHDRASFTQGLVWADSVFLEGTGGVGHSRLLRVDPATGDSLQQVLLDSQYFGEGVDRWNGMVIQLTWQTNVAFVYQESDFSLITEYSYGGEGWGITNDGTQFVMSNGSDTLYCRDFNTFELTDTIAVTSEGDPVSKLNELEYINGEIYANVFGTNRIAIINPDDGVVRAWIDLTGILDPADREINTDVLNGIAYDAVTDRLFVTGKLWPWIYEIDLVYP